MDGVKRILKIGKVRIIIRNRYHSWFSDTWHLINIERRYYQGRIEYKFCLVGFEMVYMVSTD